MIWFRRITTRIYRFFLKNYCIIFVSSIILAATTAFFHIQFKYQNRDLIFWLNRVQPLYQQYEYVLLLATVTFLIIKVFITIFMFAMNANYMEWFESLTRLDVKQRYRNFLFVRLLSEISKIKDRELKDKTIVSLDSFIKMHEDIHEKIAKFRSDGRKLLTPSEIEMSLPLEELYTESETVDRRFRHLNLDEDDLKELINS